MLAFRASLKRACNTTALCRGLSTSAPARARNAYPFPKHAHPTPHDIFHLSPGASQAEIKQRYIELVKLYHPDSPSSRPLPAEARQARFLAIGAAYNVLRGRTPPGTDGTPAAPGSATPGAAARGAMHSLNTELWKRRQARRADLRPGVDERWKDRLIVGVVVVSIVGLVGQSAASRAAAVVETRERARLYAEARADERGMERRRRVRDEEALAAPDAEPLTPAALQSDA